ncbi:diphthine methyltransferase-like isoform X2 [Uranotaenia lowii]|uniref:diphthine methyltransferase-like isoform X2 n=1 Tax=Uranotaenia lowii TaxID=190385 RepID=UPI00247A81C3|nr:diphthine methyltransferase-like isoform X2 [Uranotaenia lowii]XP_055611769.1 diphthine methyltransferase-like isoform X2 [Uranotaenia lowii]
MPSIITTLHTYDTDYSADSIEWCPHNPYQQFFVCGTYQLDKHENPSTASNTEGSTIRKGRILLFSFDVQQNSLIREQTIESSAILDQKWHPTLPTLVAANAGGVILLYELGSERNLVQKDVFKIPSNNEELLALSIDWSSEGDRALVSDSKGCISVIDVNTIGLQLLNRWTAHSFEAWACAFDRTDPNVLYTGGDDTFLCVYDIRCLTVPAIRTKNKNHTAGVTTLLSLRHKEHLLASGSYDDNLRLFDTRNMKYSLSETNLGGGIWRLKTCPSQPELILCACMYHNFSVVTLNEDHSISVEAEYNEHDSICYGCDWSYGPTGRGAKYFASCSFYDHKMCLAVLKSD